MRYSIMTNLYRHSKYYDKPCYLVIAKSLDQLWDVEKNVVLKVEEHIVVTTPYHTTIGPIILRAYWNSLVGSSALPCWQTEP